MKLDGFGVGVGAHKEHFQAKKNKHKNFAKRFPLEMGISTGRAGDFLSGSCCACKDYLWRQGSPGFQIVQCYFITDGKAISRKVLTMNF